MDDPTRRSRGVWPRDRPIRWSGVVNNLTWYVVATAALLLQIALALPVLVLGGGVAGTVLALVWGAMTLFAAWSWITWRWRVVIAPLVTIAAILVRVAVGGL
jgi:fatty acid desaturase